jgi:hypothetical protein
MVRMMHRSLGVADAEDIVSDQQASRFMRAAVRRIAEGGSNAPA